MDERQFVSFLKNKFPFHHGLGIGDDASAVRVGRYFQLVSTDILIEDVHFRLQDFSLPELAEKSLAVNLSDIAAMGGRAQYFYLCLGFPDRLASGQLRPFFSKLSRAAKKWRVELAGGDYSRSEKMVVAITVVGRCKKPVLRSGARPGDWIAVTGPTGESALGLKLLLDGEKDSPFIRRHKHTVPQCEKGLKLAGYAHAMIDLSDGLLLDLSRLLKASGVGGEIDYEKLPVSPRFRQLCRQKDYREKELVLAGGEDYQLLFALSPLQESRLRKTGMAYHLIGKISAGRRLRVLEKGRPLQISRLGFDHFADAANVKKR
jgi:thiamine-monophosphate kinase